ncbi:ATP-dependent helicase, partial [Patescibacteria group bacterium]|nr:ATP-dependent helicase [Patescibacteria group bacterium]
VISSSHKLPWERAFKAVKSQELRQLLEMAIERTEVLNRRFRHCATRGLMILRNYKGKTKSAGRQQVSSRILLSAVKRIDNNFTILREARREVLEDLMDIKHAELVVQGIEQGLIKIKKLDTGFPSPFAFNLMVQGYADILKMEDKLSFIKRMHEQVMQKIDTKTNK